MNMLVFVALFLTALSCVDGHDGNDRDSLSLKAIAKCIDNGKYPCRVNTVYQPAEYVPGNPYTQYGYYGNGIARDSGNPANVHIYRGNTQPGYRTNPFTSIAVTDIMCIPKHQLCDGIRQCPLADDEEECPGLCSSAKGEVQCSNGICATPCNGHDECPHGVDEKNCAVCPDDKIGCKLVMTGKMGCANVCDEHMECVAGLDEQLCRPKCLDSEIICPEDKDKTKYKCAKPCDGQSDCPHNEDEEKCRINYTEERVCLSGQFGCPGCELVDACEGLVIRGIIAKKSIPYCRNLFDDTICHFIGHYLDHLGK